MSEGTRAKETGPTDAHDRPGDVPTLEPLTTRTERSLTGFVARAGEGLGTAKNARWGSQTMIVSVAFGLALAAYGCGGQDLSGGAASGGNAPGGNAPSEVTSSGGTTQNGDAVRETTASEAAIENSAEDSPTVRTFALPGEEVFPEGVAYDPASGDFFVGSTQDGTVYRGNVGEGPGEMEVFLEPGGDGREGVTGMKVDAAGRLWIAGRRTGRAFVYDARSAELVKILETSGGGSALINDVTVTPDAAYFTDSFRPVIFRVPLTPRGVGEIEPWLNLEGTSIEYGDGFNLNGIAATGDGRYLITVHFATGELFRIDAESKEATQVNLGGETLATGDGLLLDGRTLYVVRENPGEVVPVELSEDFTAGKVGEPFSDPSLRFPTTVAKHDDRLLVVNSQLNMGGGGGGPELPFTVSDLPIPPAEGRQG